MTEELTAYVLINSDINHEDDVLNGLKELAPFYETKIVEDPKKVYGVYDIVAKLRGNEKRNIEQYVKNGVRKLEHVKSTLLLIGTGVSFEQE